MLSLTNTTSLQLIAEVAILVSQYRNVWRVITIPYVVKWGLYRTRSTAIRRVVQTTLRGKEL